MLSTDGPAHFSDRLFKKKKKPATTKETQSLPAELHPVSSITSALADVRNFAAALLSLQQLAASEVLKDSQKLQPQGNGCYRNRTYVRCPFSDATSPNTSSRRGLLPPALGIKIERYQRIRISWRTAARYRRPHLLQPSGGRLAFRRL